MSSSFSTRTDAPAGAFTAAAAAISFAGGLDMNSVSHSAGPAAGTAGGTAGGAAATSRPASDGESGSKMGRRKLKIVVLRRHPLLAPT